MQPRNNNPQEFMLWVALVLAIIACFMLAHGAEGQVLRPGLSCSESDLRYCQIFNLDPCPCGDAEIGRVAASGPPVDPWLGSYVLPHAIAPTMVAYEDLVSNPNPTRHYTNYGLLDELIPQGWGGMKIWMDSIPWAGTPWPVCWGPYYDPGVFCYEEDYDPTENRKFFESLPDNFVVVLRPESLAWTWYEDNNCIDSDNDHAPQMALADYYAIATWLYELIGDRDVTIILSDWEQDWIICNGYEDFLLRIVQQRQLDVERARKEAYLKRGYRPNLRVMHSVILNKNPLGAPEWEHPYLAELLPTLDHQPDLIGVSYWLRGIDPTLVLDWYEEVTGYPRYRFYIDEFGGNAGEQEERFASYIPAFREWGINLVSVWLYKQTWCGTESGTHRNKGLWYQQQPCLGKVIWTEPTAGYWELRRQNEQ